MVGEHVGVFEAELDESAGARLMTLFLQGGAADEVVRLVPSDREAEPRLERRVFVADVVAPVAVAALKAQCVHGVIPGVCQLQSLRGLLN